MKSSRFIKWSIIILIICSACTSSTDKASTYLSQAEELIWNNPDSALHILQTVPAPESLGGRQQADYALLLSHTQYRCNIPASSDSLINIAVEYYKAGSNMDKKGEAWYVKGAILKDTYNDIPHALVFYKKAETCIPAMQEKRLIARIYSSLGYLNNRSCNYEMAKEYYKKALHVNTNIKDVHSQMSDLVNLSNIYYIINYQDSLNWCINQLQHLGTTITDSVLLAKVYHNIGIQQLQIGNNEKAEKLFLDALQFTPKYPSDKTLAQLAKLYIKTNREKQADSLYHNILNASDLSVRASIYNNLYQKALAEEKYKEAIHYADLYMTTVDSFYTNNLHKEVLKIQKEYDRMELQYRHSQLYTRWLLTLLLSIFILGISIYVFKHYQIRIRQKHGKLQSEIALLQNRLAETSQMNIKTAQTYKMEIKKKQEEVNKLNNRMKILAGTYHDSLHNDDIKSITAALNLIGSRTCDLSQDRIHLKHWLNISRNNFAERLEKGCPILKEHYLDVCYLTILGLSIDETAQILHVNTRTIERYMGKICMDMESTQRGKKGFMEFLNEFCSINL